MNHRDHITIGSTPAEEPCIGAGEQGSHRETLIYARQLKREFPAGVFTVKAFEHDFGRYYEVVACYETEEQRKAAFDAERGCNGTWDSAARVELVKALGVEYFTKYGTRLPTAEETAEYEREEKAEEEAFRFRRGG